MSDIKLYQLLKESIREEKPVALATIIISQDEDQVRPGRKLAVFAKNHVEGSLGDAGLDKKVIEEAAALLRKEKSKTLTYEFADSLKVDVYIESMLPPPPLIIMGGDPDSVPLVRAAKQLGFKVVLVDHRKDFANPQKYPDADMTVISRPEDLERNVPFNERAFVLIKTHNYLQDKEILKTALKSDARYVGQLGPKARANDLLEDLRKEGVEFNQKQLDKLFAPVGLDIGAETPEEIATSILAELLAIKSGRDGGSLRNQSKAIHPRD